MFFQVLCKQDHELSGLWETLEIIPFWPITQILQDETPEGWVVWLSPKCLNTLVICSLIKTMHGQKGWAHWSLCVQIKQRRVCLHAKETGCQQSLLAPGWLCWQVHYPSTPFCHHPSLRRVQDLDRIWAPNKPVRPACLSRKASLGI